MDERRALKVDVPECVCVCVCPYVTERRRDLYRASEETPAITLIMGLADSGTGQQ